MLADWLSWRGTCNFKGKIDPGLRFGIQFVHEGTEVMKEKIVNRKAQAQRGYTIVELIVAVAIIMILAALAIPGYRRTVQYMRISGDMRNLNAVVAQAKMRAAADFTRLFIILTLAELLGDTAAFKQFFEAAQGRANRFAIMDPHS